MINNIHSLTSTYPNLVLTHPLRKQVYSIDSVNLIVGNSGSGKSNFIRDIIHHLCGDATKRQFEFDGDVDDLGVIYYSASPFRDEMFFKIKRGAHFLDISSNSFSNPVYKPDPDGAGNSALRHQMKAIETAVMILSEDVSNFLIFVDNADMLLDMEQQRSYVATVDKMLSNVRTVRPVQSMQLVLSAHSPLIATDVFSGAIVRLPYSNQATEEASDKLVGFAGTLQSVVNYTFRVPMQGLVAERTVAQLNEGGIDIKNRQNLIAEICDDWTRSYLSK